MGLGEIPALWGMLDKTNLHQWTEKQEGDKILGHTCMEDL
jgi:hypothetical protein